MAADQTEQSPWTRPGFVAAAVVVALVLVLAAVLGVNALGEDDGEEPTPPVATGTPAPTPSETAAVAGDESVCGLEGVELEGTVTAAPEAEWALIGTTAAPSSASAGPGVVEESGMRYCFQRTPEGAVFAAANMLALGEDPSIRDDFIDRLVAAGPGRDAFRELSSDEPTAPEPVRIQTAGFRVLEYTGDAATIDLAIETSTGAVGAVAYSLVWEDGDWRARFRDDGTLWNLPVQLPDLTGYVLWAGV